MQSYNEKQVNALEVMSQYHSLLADIHTEISQVTAVIVRLHILKKEQGWFPSDEMHFTSLVYKWEYLKMKLKEVQEDDPFKPNTNHEEQKTKLDQIRTNLNRLLDLD